MLSGYSSNVILAKVRAMYGKRITTKDYNNLMSCATVTDVAMYLKSNTDYEDELININEREIHRGQLEDLIKKKLFHDLESLGRYEISTGDNFAGYIIVCSEIEQILHSLMYLMSGNPSGYIYSLPMFFNKRTKINLMALTEIKNYNDFLDVLKNTPYAALLEKYKSQNNQRIDISAVEKTLYNYLYGKFFEILDDKGTSKKVKSELSEILNAYIDYSNFVRIIRIKRNNGEVSSAVLDYGTLRGKYIEQMSSASDESEVFDIMKSTNRGKKLEKMQFNYIDELPEQVLYDKCKKSIRFSVQPIVVMLSYIFLLQIEISNIIKIIEGVRYEVPPTEMEKLLIMKNQNREGVV